MPGIMEFEHEGFSDDLVDKTFADSKDIINSLENEQIKKIVFSLGADRCEERSNYYVFPTICHNTDIEDASMKLYYYFDRKVFVCYTECNDAFNIISLVIKVKRLNENDNYSYYEARDYVLNFVEGKISKTEHTYESIEDKYRRNITANKLLEYDTNILKTFPQIPHASWIRDGIKVGVMKKFDIRYGIDKEIIVIPYRDIDGRLIGIRVRNLNYDKNNDVPKYCPLITSKTTYSHPLSLSLYGVYENQEAIRRHKSAIIFEGEKSVLLHRGYYGDESCAVAVCGSNISKPQIDILVKQLGVRHITIALDKEYTEYFSEKANKYFNKLYDMCSQYINYASVDFVFDSQNYINEKDSPVDKGQAVWEQLYRTRVSVKG